MEKHKGFNGKLIPISLMAVNIIKYPNDFSEESEYIKNIQYASAQELELSDIGKTDLEKSGRVNIRVKTSVDKYVVHSEPLKKLYDFFTHAINDYTKNILNSDKKLKISGSWISKSQKGEWTEPHTHLSTINGVFYFNVPDDTTPLMFDTYNCLEERYDISIKVKEGDLVLFPNELSHWVPTNKNEKDRYCLAFSTIPETEFNRSVSLVHSYSKKYSKTNKSK